jgi:hypothetical protein
MTKTEYTKFLNSIDRNYEYSDSFSVYKQGERAFKIAQEIARSDDELLMIYNKWIIAENKK